MKADDLTIREPCAEDWSAMTGDGPRRYCDACERSVHNLSQMTEAEADALLRSRTGRLCVRYAIGTDGTIRFRPEPTPAPVLVQLRPRPDAEPRRPAALARAAVAAGLLAACTPHTHDGSPSGCLDGTLEMIEGHEVAEMGELVEEPPPDEPTLAPLRPIPMPGVQAILPTPPPLPPEVVEVQGGIAEHTIEPPPPPPEADPFPELMGDIAEPDPPIAPVMGRIAAVDEDVPCDTPPKVDPPTLDGP